MSRMNSERFPSIALVSQVASAIDPKVQASGGQGHLRAQSAVARCARRAKIVSIGDSH
ncbi:hypothetical protein [Paraburkholderia youngii]|uniref:hypothetical protein n=1 Tax=Paraburkholderia youngii TaxID=2782701 RepID=UPI0015959F66|nr:hypothetical protein [Paraburkholderia youngii]